MPTWMPRSRSGAAMSSARGNWFDCTPTSITMPAPAASIIAARRARTDAGIGLVEGVDVDLDVVARARAARRSPWRGRRAQASEFDGIDERSHWMT